MYLRKKSSNTVDPGNPRALPTLPAIMARSAILAEKLRRVLVFGAVTLVVAMALNAYARIPFDPVQLAWGLFGVLIGLVEQFFFTGLVAHAALWLQLLLRIVIIWFAAMAVVSLLLLAGWVPPAFRQMGVTDVGTLWSSIGRTGLMTNALVVAAVVMLFMEMERMVGSRMFRRFLLGRYVRPRREDRVVMFMDLAGSTTHTERLGDDRMTGPILAHDAEVLKYIGDEVVFTWIARGDERDLRCLQLFLDIRQAIERDRSHYERTYAMVPRFRAGCHRGVVITAQIGSIKRSIDLSGDAMNTCARLAGATKDLHADLVASGDLLNGVRDAASRFRIGEAVPLDLKGKADAVRAHVIRSLSE